MRLLIGSDRLWHMQWLAHLGQACDGQYLQAVGGAGGKFRELQWRCRHDYGGGLGQLQGPPVQCQSTVAGSRAGPH